MFEDGQNNTFAKIICIPFLYEKKILCIGNCIHHVWFNNSCARKKIQRLGHEHEYDTAQSENNYSI
jgi:hypothetical protein